VIVILASALASTAGSVPSDSSYEALVSVAAPFMQCERRFTPRLAALNEQLSSEVAVSEVRTDLVEGVPFTVINKNTLEGLKSIQALNVEISDTCDRARYFSALQAKVKELRPSYPEAEIAAFSRDIFRDIERQSLAVADFEAGHFKMPVPPMPLASPPPQVKLEGGAP